MRTRIWAASIILAACASGPALADVKAGVDAWSRGDYRTAIAEWRGPATAGDADAQFNLGQAYKLGRGVPVDLAMAEEWYRKAALQGHQQAEDNYGLALFQNGRRDKAVPWLEKSAARGEPRAQYVLGTMYFNADVVKRDWVRAYALMTRASGAGIAQATTTLAQMDGFIPLADRQKGTALARQLEVGVVKTPPPVAYVARDTPPTPPVANVETAPQPRPAAIPKPAVVASKPVAAPAPRPPVAASGAYRVQLGAFRDPDGARRMWAQLGSRFPGRQPYYVKAGALTRLLVGPYPTQADAARGCGSVRPCVPTR
ncbi:SPOR domain-containing protein [Sphingomonas donggukensis]|uniref:SPOR domain-containing protein n=1 Tax=Sphingomonas donggukensis TaxID=2949093 RepID=A0ABY4TV58_9SPHN|nr:SPOR domain-containing protein [Sphingomonas donggukensis]URW76247.1 SPOR domain-containing protein [Sphingomonas donggukensis]